MFTKEQVSAAIAFNACVDPNTSLGKYLRLVTQITAKADDLQLTPSEQKQGNAEGLFTQRLAKAIFADGKVTAQEQELLNFMEQLKTDQAVVSSLQSDIAALTNK